jgi:hypothetical protein
MFARLAPFVLSLIVGVTPIAPEVCELFCASSMPAHHMTMEAAHDGCGPQVSQVPSCCADADRAPASQSSVAKIVINPPTMIARSVSVEIANPIAIDVAPRINSPRAPIPLALRTPLRL